MYDVWEIILFLIPLDFLPKYIFNIQNFLLKIKYCVQCKIQYSVKQTSCNISNLSLTILSISNIWSTMRAMHFSKYKTVYQSNNSKALSNFILLAEQISNRDSISVQAKNPEKDKMSQVIYV